MNNISKRVLFLSILIAFMTNKSSAADLVVLRGNEDYPPDEMHIDGELTGFNIELIQNVARSISLSVEFESVPWKRAIKMLEKGERDAISYFSKNPTRDKYAIFLSGNILSETNYHFIANNNRQKEIHYNGNIKNLSQYAIGIQRGYYYGETFNKENFPNQFEFNSVNQLKNSLLKNRIDLAILTMEEYQDRINNNDFTSITILYPALDASINYLAFSKVRNTNKHAELFAKAMEIYKTSEDYIALKNKYNK